MEQKRILLIEDEKSISEILTYKLNKEGYDIRSTNTGNEGLRLIIDFNPDLILLDIMLPDMNGFDIFQIIKANYDIPVIMLTARSDKLDINRGLELGVYDYVTKPFDINELLEKIRKVWHYSL